MLSFCYHKRLSGYSPGNRFSLSFVILFRFIQLFQTTEKPRKPCGSGVSYVWTHVPCGTQYILISDYSMIVATRPDPTVRPPSRYRSCILRRFFRIFLSFYYHFQPEIRSVFLILNYFVIILLSQLLW